MVGAATNGYSSGKTNQQIGVKGSTVVRCGGDSYKFSHLLDLDKITTCTHMLNQWVDKIPDFIWTTKPQANSVANAKNDGEAGKITPP